MTEENLEKEYENESSNYDVYALDYTSEEDPPQPTLVVVRCNFVKTSPIEDLCHTSLLYTYTKCNDQV